VEGRWRQGRGGGRRALGGVEAWVRAGAQEVAVVEGSWAVNGGAAVALVVGGRGSAWPPSGPPSVLSIHVLSLSSWTGKRQA